MVRCFIFVVAVFALCGCATISRDDEVVSVDSDPRGIPVFMDRDSRALGYTPLFVRVPRNGTHKFYFATSTQSRKWIEFDCDLSWPLVYLGNGIPSVLFGVSSPYWFGVGAAGILTDIFAGDGYSCEKSLVGDLTREAQGMETRYCPRMLILPPGHYDDRVSELVASSWVESVRSEMRECTTFVNHELAKRQFAYINVDHLHPADIDDITRDNLRELGRWTGATHLVHLETRTGEDRIMVKPRIYDMHKERLLASEALNREVTVKFDSSKTLAKSKRNEFIIKTFNLLPNSLTFSIGNPEISDAGQNDDYYVGDRRQLRRLPTYFANWGLRSIDHPRGFGEWDIALNLSPSGSTGFQAFHYDLYPVVGGHVILDEEQLFGYDIEIFHAALVMDLGLTLHTPLGAWTATYGLGGSYFHSQDQFKKADQLAAVRKSGLIYRAFWSQNLYFQISQEYYRPMGTDSFLDNGYIVRRGWEVSSFGIGYFLPQMRLYLRNLL